MEEEIKTGDLLWGKVESHPWWPGIVCIEPNLNQHKKSNNKGTFYNMQFLSNPPSRGWVKDRNMKEFKGTNVAECKMGGMFYSAKKSFKDALEEADKAQPMIHKERLKYVQNSEGDSELELLGDIESMTFILGETKIPMEWETSYVLMNTNDVPEDLDITGFVKVPNSDGKKSPKKSPPSSAKKSPPSSAKKSPPSSAKKSPPSSAKKSQGKSEQETVKKITPKKITPKKTTPKKTTPKAAPKAVPKTAAKRAREEEENSGSEEEEMPKAKRGRPVKKNYEEVDDWEEDILSDEDPWDPGADGDMSESDIDISSCEEDDEWAPSETKKIQGVVKKTKKFGYKKKMPELTKIMPKPALPKPALPKPSGSLKAYLPPKLVEDQPSENPATPPPLASTAPAIQLIPLVIDAKTTTGPQPEIGDFMIEKSQCSEGTIPFLWRYKKGGLLQKYEKTVDKDQTLYVNILSFSDWWPCYSNRYQKVLTKGMFKYKNVEKVMLLETLGNDSAQSENQTNKETNETEKEQVSSEKGPASSEKDSTNTEKEPTSSEKEPTNSEKEPANTAKEPANSDKNSSSKGDTTANAESTKEHSNTDKESGKDNNNASRTDTVTSSSTNKIDAPQKKTQEQVVSSTTPDNSDFQVGRFVLDKKEERNTDSFSIWKVESSILLRKYEPLVKNGQLYHQPMKTYRGFKDNDIHKFYTPIKVIYASKIGTDYVEVLEECRPKLVVNLSLEEEYDKHPLLRHFYVYLQVFLSQALEPGFLENVQKNKEDSFIFPLGEIDKIISQKIMNVERKVRWTTKIKRAMQKCPFLREVYKPDSKRQCEAIVDSTDPVEENVFLFGPEYDSITLAKESEKSVTCQDFKVGKNAISHISTYHKLCHFKYYLYEKCTGKIRLIRERNINADVTDIMDACLGNKAWVLQNFEDFMQLVEIGPC